MAIFDKTYLNSRFYDDQFELPTHLPRQVAINLLSSDNGIGGSNDTIVGFPQVKAVGTQIGKKGKKSLP